MDSGLIKRLLGALVLIVLAIIFVPMLLPGNPDSSSQQASLKIPAKPNGEMQTRTLQVGPDSASAGPDTQAAVTDPDHVAQLNLEAQRARQLQALSSGPPIEPTTEPPASAPAASATLPPKASSPQPAPISAPAPASAPVASLPAKPVAGGAGAAAGVLYTVNLGIYADRASADKLVADAKQQGFAALASPETFHGKPVSRVTVGPFNSRADAEAARLKLKGVTHVPMSVAAASLNQKGNAPASALPAGKPGAWAVQLAAFSDQASADKLRDRLRGQGFDGFVDSIKTSNGTLWRVRAGPFTSRDVASTTRDAIARKLGVKAVVVGQD